MMFYLHCSFYVNEKTGDLFMTLPPVSSDLIIINTRASYEPSLFLGKFSRIHCRLSLKIIHGKRNNTNARARGEEQRAKSEEQRAKGEEQLYQPLPFALSSMLFALCSSPP